MSTISTLGIDPDMRSKIEAFTMRHSCTRITYTGHVNRRGEERKERKGKDRKTGR